MAAAVTTATATARKVTPVTAAMISMPAMATTVTAAGIERISGDIGYDSVVKHARWRSLIQIESIKIIGAVKIPGK